MPGVTTTPAEEPFPDGDAIRAHDLRCLLEVLADDDTMDEMLGVYNIMYLMKETANCRRNSSRYEPHDEAPRRAEDAPPP